MAASPEVIFAEAVVTAIAEATLGHQAAMQEIEDSYVGGLITLEVAAEGQSLEIERFVAECQALTLDPSPVLPPP